MGSTLGLMDKGDRMLYFEEDSTEADYTFDYAINHIYTVNPQWTAKTDDYGYFRRAFDYHYEDEFWEPYDVFLIIAIIMPITVLLWLIIAIFDIRKHVKLAWSFACYV